ncbi:MAG: NADH-quinone oxidoreductase subunit M [Trueperaceae bacterium]|nr:NADH-quinone oxidoreductase subunit M [Trueperaceae bacterium]
MTAAMVLIPLIAAALVWRAPRRAAGALALLATSGTFVLALFLSSASALDLAWLPAAGIGFRLDPAGVASVLVLAASLAMIPTVLAAATQVARSTGAFLALLLAMQAGLNGLFLSSDLVLTYVFWEATLFFSVFLLGGWGREGRRGAVTKYLIYAVAGSFLMLVSILALRPLSGAESYAFADLLPATRALDVVTQAWLFAGFAAAFAVKLPMFPLHSWLIDFHDQNHPSGAADVAGTLYKVGGFGFFAWAIPLLPLGAQAFQPWMLALTSVTALWAALAATQQTDLKRLLAYASLSHMGLVGVGLFSLHPAGMTGAMALLVAQMFSTGGLFLLSGMLYARRGSFALDRFGGLARSAPALAAVTLLALFASIGVPGLSNFPGEFMSLLGAFQTHVAAAVLATLAVIAAGAYGVNLYQRLYQGRQREATHDLRGLEVAVLAPLVAGILWMGIAPAPQIARTHQDTRVALQMDADDEEAAAPAAGWTIPVEDEEEPPGLAEVPGGAP